MYSVVQPMVFNRPGHCIFVYYVDIDVVLSPLCEVGVMKLARKKLNDGQ
jgi:hypothetical protein